MQTTERYLGCKVTFHRYDPNDTTVIAGTLRGLGTIAAQQVALTFDSLINMDASMSTPTLGGLIAGGTLPQAVGLYNLQIHWWIEQANQPNIEAGTTNHPIFITYGSPRQATRELFNLAVEKPYLSMLWIASQAGSGASDNQTLRGNLWQYFSPPSSSVLLQRVDLDVTTGNMQPGMPLMFWPPNWSVANWLSGNYLPDGQPGSNIAALLHDGVSTCQGFATLWAGMLRLEGLDATEIAPDFRRGWPSLIFAPNGQPAQYFLVGTWLFTPPQVVGMGPPITNSYPYVDGFTFVPGASGGLFSSPTIVSYIQANAQNNTSPFAMWKTDTLVPLSLQVLVSPLSTADHALVQTPDGKIWDPSYGMGPFDDLAGWANASIIGWAQFVDANGNRIDAEAGDCVKLGVCYLEVNEVVH